MAAVPAPSPASIAASRYGATFSQSTMVAEQKQTVEERRRTMLPRDAVKKSASLSPLIRQNKLTPSHAASINEGLSNALVTQSKPDLELKIARSAVRAGPLYLRECAMVALHRDRGG